jgi:CDP-6-deoxy-D-xylo-4-hexulose-3-dehydrase
MNNETTKKLRGVVEMLIADSSRINEKKPQKYWYPLSMATYGTEEILEALDSMCSFRTTMWEKTIKFEETFSDYQNCAHSIMVNSGSSADLLLSFLLREKCHNKTEVLVPAVTWPTQIWSIIVAGFTPVLVDVDPNTLNIDYNDLRSKITDKTVAMFLVHLMGNPCDMDIVHTISNENDLYVLEDCCEGLGASFNGIKIGNFGLGGAFSFFFSHHITTMEGGMVTCNSSIDSDILKTLRAHGWTRNTDNSSVICNGDIDPRYAFTNMGFNVRPTDLQAGFGIHQMEKLDAFNKKRDNIADKFFSYVGQCDWLHAAKIHNKSKPSWLGLPIIISNTFRSKKNFIMEKLEENGIETRPIVTGNIARHPVASKFPSIFNNELPGADVIHYGGFYIGISPMQKDDAIDKVIEVFGKVRKIL